MALTVIRPPLVYGPGAPGNFGALVRAVERGWPLPLGAVIGNRRSFVAIDNLVDLILTCLDHPAAVNQTFLVSDGEDLSTADLLRRLSEAMGRPARLLPVPVGVLALGAKLMGKSEMFQSLCGSLQVDMSKTLELLGWRPPIGVDEGLKRAEGGQRC
jgi:nucleoside-diphosphate-sugar epimerase